MQKRLTSFVLVLVVALFVAIPAQAATQFDAGAGVSTITSQQLPSFIPSGAVAMNDGEMSEVKGEFIPVVLYYAVVMGVPYSVAFAASFARFGHYLPFVSLRAFIEEMF